ncbi:MAG: hypothetical protein ACK4JC_06260 [Silanimonas lenta]|jgi:hypothetical protein
MADIEIRLDRLEQLYDGLDPAPFRDKALDRAAEAYLLECAEDAPGDAALRVRITVPAALVDRQPEVAAAIHAHFGWLWERAERRRIARGRVHRVAMVLGLGVLLAALGLRRLFEVETSEMAQVLREGLLILGWVALWRPVEWVLFDTWEHRQRRSALRRLSQAEVRLQAE